MCIMCGLVCASLYVTESFSLDPPRANGVVRVRIHIYVYVLYAYINIYIMCGLVCASLYVTESFTLDTRGGFSPL